MSEAVTDVSGADTAGDTRVSGMGANGTARAGAARRRIRHATGCVSPSKHATQE